MRQLDALVRCDRTLSRRTGDHRALPIFSPFPFWLDSDSPIEYLGRLFSSRALGRWVRRVQLGLGLRTPSAPDGYWNYELLGHGEFRPAPPPNEPAHTGRPVRPDAISCGCEQLAGFIADVPNVPVVLVMPPIIASNIPRAAELAKRRGLQPARGRWPGARSRPTA